MTKQTTLKTSITKSRSGHYTATVREVGTWEANGRTYPYNEVVFKAEKLNSVEQARASIPSTQDFQAALGPCGK